MFDPSGSSKFDSLQRQFSHFTAFLPGPYGMTAKNRAGKQTFNMNKSGIQNFL